MTEQAHPDEGSKRAVEGDPRAGAEHQGESQSAPDLLAGRRQLLIGTVGFSAFAATLASRPAFANVGGGGCGPISALCSPAHSTSPGRITCNGWHTDYWCNYKSRWPVNCDTATFSSCGFKLPWNCGFSGSMTLKEAICSAYPKTSTPTYWNKTHGSYDSNYSGGWYTYQSDCDLNNLACWMAAGLLNSMVCPNFGYDKASFIAACTTVLNSRNPECYTSIQKHLCSTISSICTLNRSSSPCGGPSSIWS